MSTDKEVTISHKVNRPGCRESIAAAKSRLRQIQITKIILSDDIDSLDRQLSKKKGQLEELVKLETQQYDSLSSGYRQLGIPELTLTRRRGDGERFDLKAEVFHAKDNTTECLLSMTIRVGCGPRPVSQYVDHLTYLIHNFNFDCRRFADIGSPELWACVYEWAQKDGRPSFDRFFSNGRLYSLKALIKPKKGKKK